MKIFKYITLVVVIFTVSVVLLYYATYTQLSNHDASYYLNNMYSFDAPVKKVSSFRNRLSMWNHYAFILSEADFEKFVSKEGFSFAGNRLPYVHSFYPAPKWWNNLLKIDKNDISYFVNASLVQLYYHPDTETVYLRY